MKPEPLNFYPFCDWSQMCHAVSINIAHCVRPIYRILPFHRLVYYIEVLIALFAWSEWSRLVFTILFTDQDYVWTASSGCVGYLDAKMASHSESNESLTAPWPNKKDDYELMESIGVGATATVFKVIISLCFCWQRVGTYLNVALV
jgi:hypothetical protein